MPSLYIFLDLPYQYHEDADLVVLALNPLFSSGSCVCLYKTQKIQQHGIGMSTAVAYVPMWCNSSNLTKISFYCLLCSNTIVHFTVCACVGRVETFQMFEVFLMIIQHCFILSAMLCKCMFKSKHTCQLYFVKFSQWMWCILNLRTSDL